MDRSKFTDWCFKALSSMIGTLVRRLAIESAAFVSVLFLQRPPALSAYNTSLCSWGDRPTFGRLRSPPLHMLVINEDRYGDDAMPRKTAKQKQEEADRKARKARDEANEAAKAVRAEEKLRQARLEVLLGSYTRRRLAGDDGAARRRKAQIADALGPTLARPNDRDILAEFLGTELPPYDKAVAEQYRKGVVPSGKGGDASGTGGKDAE